VIKIKAGNFPTIRGEIKTHFWAKHLIWGNSYFLQSELSVIYVSYRFGELYTRIGKANFTHVFYANFTNDFNISTEFYKTLNILTQLLFNFINFIIIFIKIVIYRPTTTFK